MIDSVALNNDASILATVCLKSNTTRCWDVRQGMFVWLCHMLIRPGTLLMQLDEAFESPLHVLFFNLSTHFLIVATKYSIFITDVTNQLTKSVTIISYPELYGIHALALSADDSLLVAGNVTKIFAVCCYNTASLERLWIYKTGFAVCSVCMLSSYVLVAEWLNPTLILDLNTGARIASLHDEMEYIFGLGVIEGLLLLFFCKFALFIHLLRPPHFSVPCNAAASPLQTTQFYAFAVGNVGLDRQVSPRLVVIG
jgi:hypothetical protein